MATFMDEYSNLVEKIFANFDRPFKEIEQYKLYRKDDKGYLMVINTLGIDKDNLNVSLEYSGAQCYRESTGGFYLNRMPVLKVIGKKKNRITGVEYSVNLGLGLNIREEIEGIYFDCADGVCVINIKVKQDKKESLKANQIPEDFVWNK